MKLTRSKLKEIIREEIQNLQERTDYTIALARAYHVAMDQKDYDELGKKVDRNKFKKYFHIPRDADEDPNYKRDPKFNIKKLTQIKELNEENPDRDLFRSLNRVNNDLFRIMNKYQGKADLDAGFRSWMMGLHAHLKKAGINLGRIK